MFLPSPLFAVGLNELVSILIGAVFLLLWVLSQINDARKKMGPQAPQPPAFPPQPPRAGAAAGGPAAGDPLRAQIDEFLRRAQQARVPQPAGVAGPAAQGGAPRAAGRDDVELLLDDGPAAPERKPLAEPLRSMGDATPTPRGTQPRQPAPLRERQPRRLERTATSRPKSVAEHVAEHVVAATEQIRDEVSHLGERVKKADEQFDVQLQQKFDHELGSLANRHAARMQDQQAPAKAISPAGQIAAMLANPDGVRQAIVINEILRRPDDRW